MINKKLNQILEEPKSEINPIINEEKKDVKVEENKKSEEDNKEKEEKKEESKKIDGDKTEDTKFKKLESSPVNKKIRKSTTKHIKIKYKRTCSFFYK